MDKYTAHYQVFNANQELIAESEIVVNHKGDAKPESPESKEVLENQILLSLDVAVIKLEKNNE